MIYARYGKRLLDLIIVVPALIWALPVMAIVAALVRVRLGAPVLFKQQRLGLNGRLFTIYKFRTMTNARDAAGAVLPDAQRLTPLGRFLRATSLDELPELFNALKGEMSLVGPRPLLSEYLDRYTPEQERRHDLRPGITGWAQVNGRNALTWDEKFAHDLWYVDHVSLWRDLKIILLTLLGLFNRQGVSHAGHDTMPEFRGSGKIDNCG